MYSQDGWGLGHLRRSLNIAGEVRLADHAGQLAVAVDAAGEQQQVPADRIGLAVLRAG